MDVDTIFRHVRETYANAGSYCDRAEILIVEGEGMPQLRGRFRTAFVRSRGLRFEFQLISRDGRIASEFSMRTEHGKLVEVRGLNEPGDSVGGTIARMTGITFGAADAVPPMLLPIDVPGCMLCESGGAVQMLSSESIDGVEYFVVAKVERVGPQAVLFIRASDFLLRRVVYRGDTTPRLLEAARLRNISVTKLGPWTQTTTYEPQIHAGEAEGIDLDW